MVRDAQTKMTEHSVQRYYILTTSEPCIDPSTHQLVINEVSKVHRETGRLLITNGVWNSILYYLRLLETPDHIVERYVALVRSDPDIRQPQREALDVLIDTLDTSGASP